MLRRNGGYLEAIPDDSAPLASQQLQREGYTVLRGVLDTNAVADLAAELSAIYERLPPDRRNPNLPPDEAADFRYEMLNRSALAQRAIAHPQLLATIEPLLGEDCHIIANTCWRNPPREKNVQGGGAWHIDAGPHVPRPAGVAWPDDVPYPIFAIGSHIYLRDCPLECGPTGVIPGSHRSGRHPPRERAMDDNLTCDGVGVVPLLASAGDIALFVSDVWHRRLRCLPGDSGRFFLQAHYGRRDIAQRLRTTSEVNQLSADAITRATTDRARSVIGLHRPFFYDG